LSRPDKHDITNRLADKQRIVFYTGAIYLLIYTIFAVIFYKERCMQDAGFMLFDMANTGQFPFAQNRFIIYLLNLFPVFSIKAGLPLKAVVISWNLNYSLFYLLAFLIVLKLLKDPFTAFLILFVHLFTMAAQNYNIADEIIPSAVLLAVFLSVLRYPGEIKEIILYPVYLFLLFFTVFGHILVPLAFLLAGIYYVGVNFESSVKMIRKLIIPGGVFLVFLALRFGIGMKDDYERDNMSASPSQVMDIISGLNGSELLGFFRFYWVAFTVCCLLGILLFLHFIRKRKWKEFALIGILLAVYWLIWYINISDSTGEMQLSSRDFLVIRRLFPFNFIILFAWYDQLKHDSVFRGPGVFKTVRNVFIIGAVIQFYAFYKLLPYPQHTLQQYYRINETLTDEQVDKYYLDFNTVCQHIYYHSVFGNSILFTALDGPDKARQIIFAHEDEMPAIETTAPGDLYFARGVEINLDQMNKRYFDLQETPYQKVSVDLNDCDEFVKW